MKNVPKSSAVRVDERGRGGGQRREENVLKSMREFGELLILGLTRGRRSGTCWPGS